MEPDSVTGSFKKGKMMSTNLVDEMTEQEAKNALNDIFNIFTIGGKARTPSVLMTNLENIKRFSGYLHAIEREFFMVAGEPDEDYPDDEPDDVCLVNSWGRDQDQYVSQFKNALDSLQHQAMEAFKDELVKSISPLYKPHIEGVLEVVKIKMQGK